MLETIRFRRAVWAGVISLILSVAACDKGSSGGTVESTEAARENVEAMSLEHADDTNEPSAAAEISPTRAVESETLPYADVDDQLAYGYLAYPSGVLEPLPAVVMIHEWWGLNDNIRAMANRLASEGYMVLAVDLYGGETAATPAEARRFMLRVVENPGIARENIRQALGFLKIAEAPAIASLGWCFGGGWSLNAAMSFPEDVDASVIYYGQVTDDSGKLQTIEGPILGLFGADDRGISVASVRSFKAALQRLRKENDIQIYPGVGHAFANPTGNNYNEAAAENAWKRTLKFLDENLRPGDAT
jgi:carboxymethylenebutenolidase